ncbi:hypothetical protein [Klebsiella pneumoniae]|uniref:hypothetical protein n=1 Tax=Klebsiella pneumoniae TaxID=573 RepID=UPI0011579453|nr:hypothetical protein [Klebsiella pneumoniae]HDU4119662.1 hypothetical protein [Klebsiella pneumoniae subsp. pneumoniae]EMB5964470.1 hypothetical protein [Klebsiella pneumoniae]MDU5286856.1 hypothetical protein [Klebsiella pneumoniae]HBQ2264395.1 hypothetical protein [Klebsiella pneumoniae]HBR3401571.1 hypothetical protein [Klebsiella pneumoniae]
MKKNISEIECADAGKLIEKLDSKYNITFLCWWKQDDIWKLIIVLDNYNSLDKNEIKSDISKEISDIGITSFATSDCAPSGTNMIDQSLRKFASMPHKEFIRIEFKKIQMYGLPVENTIILRA